MFTTNQMIFEFPAAAIDQANAFVAEVKTNFGFDGEVLVGLDAQEGPVYGPEGPVALIYSPTVKPPFPWDDIKTLAEQRGAFCYGSTGCKLPRESLRTA